MGKTPGKLDNRISLHTQRKECAKKLKKKEKKKGSWEKKKKSKKEVSDRPSDLPSFTKFHQRITLFGKKA